MGVRTKQNCRLPTEAEWEYAARASSTTAYPWGNDVGKSNAICRSCGDWGKGDQSAPVGTFPANTFGLRDMSGNVWEWTCSAWSDAFDGSERTCLDQGDSSARVVRGGSWFDDADYARSSARATSAIMAACFDGIGFRVLCSPLVK